MNRFVEYLKQSAEDARILGKQAEAHFISELHRLFRIGEITKEQLQELLSCQ